LSSGFEKCYEFMFSTFSKNDLFGPGNNPRRLILEAWGGDRCLDKLPGTRATKLAKLFKEILR
jgi:hypothetical protein